ncbi:MAG: phosphoesterase [Pedosphaera sp.]|nr:phosphoesterase [Pedosphaera sp.]
MKIMTKFVLGAVLFPCILGLTSAQAAPTGVQIVQQIGTVFVIAMENHNFVQPNPVGSPQQIFTNPAAPFINSLITPGNSNSVHVSYATRYYAAGTGVHPSEPNYIWAEAGTDFGVHTDNDPSAGSGNVFTAPHLTGQLNAAGIPWKNYQEDVQFSPQPISNVTGTSGTEINPYYHTGQYSYAPKHNPMCFFTDTATQNVYPLANLTQDLANNTVGRYNWITPNQYNDQHSSLNGGFTYHGTNFVSDQASIAQGDNFLSIIIPQIMASQAWRSNGVIIIWTDETEGGDGTNYNLLEIAISPLAKGNAYASPVVMSHSSDIKTVEEIFGLSFLANAIPAAETSATGGYNNVATVNDLSDFFQPMPKIGVQQPASYNLTNGSSTVNFGSVNLASSFTNTFTLTNSGLATLTLTNFTLAGANPGDFTVSGISLPASIATNASATFKVAFSPAAAGPRSATLQITNSDSSLNPFTLTLAGTGVGNNPPVLSGKFTAGSGSFQLSFNAPSGQPYRLLGTTNISQPLASWTVLSSGTVSSNPVVYTDTTATNLTRRFYCLVSP